jgi:hypothetical protein
MDRPVPGLRHPRPGRLVPDRRRHPGGRRPHRRLQRHLRLRPQLRRRLRDRLGGGGPPGRVDHRRQRPAPAASPDRVAPRWPDRDGTVASPHGPAGTVRVRSVQE